MKQNMTAGPPARLIFFFTLPLLAGNLFQQLYNMVDSVVVGRFVGPTALAAVGSAFPVVFLLSSLFLGLGQGAMVLVSQFYGASDEKRLKAAVDTIYTALIVGGIPLSILGCLCVGPITGMMAIAPDALAEFRIYLLIMLGGLVGSLGYNANSGILQGLGDSKTPVLFLVVACGINIALDLLFVVVFHWGVAGVAVATIIAQACSWVFGILFINRRHPTLHISPFCFRFDKAIFAQVIRIGVPIGIQQALFSLGAMLLVRLVNSFGSDFTAGYNAANKVDTIAFLPVQSFSMAVTTFVGQNMGAGKPERVRPGQPRRAVDGHRRVHGRGAGASGNGAMVHAPVFSGCRRHRRRPCLFIPGTSVLFSVFTNVRAERHHARRGRNAGAACFQPSFPVAGARARGLCAGAFLRRPGAELLFSHWVGRGPCHQPAILPFRPVEAPPACIEYQKEAPL